MRSLILSQRFLSAAAFAAALVVVKKNAGVWLHNDTVLRLQVDDNPDPIKELKRLIEVWSASQR